MSFRAKRGRTKERIEVNERGGKSAYIGVRYDLVPPAAFRAVGGVFEHGAQKYKPNNWKQVTIESHLNHAINHIYRHLENDKSEKCHLANAATRLLMALQLELERKRK